MILGARRQSNTPNDGKIEFPRLQSWNPMTNVATIAADVGGKRVLCRISNEDLQKTFPSSEDAMKIITENRAQIVAAARRLIENKSYEEDGSIIIQYKDLCNPIPAP